MNGIGAVESVLVLVPVVLIALAIGSALGGNRPHADRFAAVNGLTLDPVTSAAVGAVLRRTYRGRLLGGLAGGAVTGVLVVGLRPSAPWVLVLAGVLVGTLAGLAAAQVRAPQPADSVRAASLEVRDVGAYLPRCGHATIVTLLVALVAYTALVAITASEAPTRVRMILGVVLLVGVATTILGSRLVRAVVERTRDRTDAARVRVDDALRAYAVRSVHHVIVGLLFCALAVAGYVGGAAQQFEGVTIGETVVFRVPTGGALDDVVATIGTGDDPTVVEISWNDANGGAHRTTRTGPPGTSYGSGGMVEHWGLVATAWYVVIASFLGALFEWGRASKAWRRPSRVAVAPPVRSSA